MAKLFAVTCLSTLLLACGCDSPAARSTQDVSSPSVDTSAPVTPPNPIDRWRVTKNVNDLDGAAQITVQNADFVLRCSPKFEAYINPNLPQLGHNLDTNSDYQQTVRFRLDKGPIRRGTWSISKTFDALFLPTATARQAVAAKQMVVEYKPEYTTSMTETFDLSGLNEAARSAGCKL